MKRLLTAAIGVPLVLAAIFLFKGWWFFALMAAVIEVAVWEYVEILRPQAPKAPLRVLLLLVPATGFALSYAASMPVSAGALRLYLFAGALLLAVGSSTLILFARTPLAEALPALGVLAFGLPYFAAALAALDLLQRMDPWRAILLLAIVWLGDTAAYYVGSRIGRRKLAPVISPKKSWEGAVASFVVALAGAAVWDVCRRGRLEPGLLTAAALTGVAAQIGDLVESLLKRSSGVKDSGNILPGHGGAFDRVDALLFAAPVLLIGLWVLGERFPVRFP
jgi:phosphatidate cytidylyltransferase